MYRSLRLAAPAAALAVLAAPAAAHAQAPATLVVPGSQCIRFFTPGDRTLPLQGANFAPNSAVTILSDGAAIDTVTADANGSFAQAVFAPAISGNRKSVAITATDNQGHNAGPLPLPEVRVGVIWPSHSKPRQRVLFRAYGFAEGQTVYLHIRRGGRTRGTFKIGRGDSPCGTTKRRLRSMPLRSYSTGVYEYWFGNTKHYDRSKEIGYRVTITRTFRAAGASASAAAAHWASLAPVGV